MAQSTQQVVAIMQGNNNTDNENGTERDVPVSWTSLLNALTGGKNIIDVSSKGIDVNLLGFSAGIGVLAEKNPESVNGGLNAVVKTPWGSVASAGFQGKVGSDGVGGGLWARGALTPDIAAKAGLGGNITPQGINGGLIAGAKAPITGEHVADLSGEWPPRRSA